MNELGTESFWPVMQRCIGEVLRHPLSRGSGTLCSSVEAIATPFQHEFVSDARADASERLAIYNRQYWFRLFSVMQQEFPLVAHLLGHWEFNAWVSDYLESAPPTAIDIAGSGDGFVEFVRTESQRRIQSPAPSIPLVQQAAEIDEAFRRIFRAPAVTPWRPDPSETARLGQVRLRAASNIAFVREEWPLVELREALDPDDECPFTPFEPLALANHWAVIRTLSGVGRVALEDAEYALFKAIQRVPLHAALPAMEVDLSESDRSRLPSRVNAWLARSTKLGFWCGLGGPEE